MGERKQSLHKGHGTSCYNRHCAMGALREALQIVLQVRLRFNGIRCRRKIKQSSVKIEEESQVSQCRDALPIAQLEWPERMKIARGEEEGTKSAVENSMFSACDMHP